MEPCDYHTILVSDIAVIKNDLAYMREKVCSHVAEGEKSGGWRDRLLICEKEIAALRTSVWKIGITSGLVGALIGNAAPEMIKLIVGLFK